MACNCSEVAIWFLITLGIVVTAFLCVICVMHDKK